MARVCLNDRGQIAWREHTVDPDLYYIYFRDTDGTVSQVGTSGHKQWAAEMTLSNTGELVWTFLDDDGDLELSHWMPARGYNVQVTDNAFDDRRPHITRRWLAWEGATDGGDYDVYRARTPEPATGALVLLGVAALSYLRRRHGRR